MKNGIGPQGLAPGISEDSHVGLRGYLIGLGFAVILTLGSFWASASPEIYGPGVPVLLGVLAIAQMGIHLVFFLHITSAPDQTNNFLALAFGIFVTGVVVFGSMFILDNMNHSMMSSMSHGVEMER